MKEALNCINLAVNFIAKAERQWHTRGFSCRLHVPVYMCMLYECAWDHLRVLVELCVVCCAVPPMRRRNMHGLAKNENNYTRYRYALYNIYVIRIYKADDNELICILRISSCFFFFLYSNHSAGRHCRIKISKVLYLDCCPLNVFVADRHHSINYSGWQITTKRWLVHQCHMWLLMQHTFVWRNVRKKNKWWWCVFVCWMSLRG